VTGKTWEDDGCSSRRCSAAADRQAKGHFSALRTLPRTHVPAAAVVVDSAKWRQKKILSGAVAYIFYRKLNKPGGRKSVQTC